MYYIGRNIELVGTAQRITQHKRFVPYGTQPNPSLTLRTSSMLGTLYDIEERFKKRVDILNNVNILKV
jgi:hypothetical protein